MTKLKVKPDEWYTLQDIVKNKMFYPLASSFWATRKIVGLDRKNGNILKVTITGTGRGSKYHFKGEHIISFIKQMNGGKIRL